MTANAGKDVEKGELSMGITSYFLIRYIRPALQREFIPATVNIVKRPWWGNITGFEDVGCGDYSFVKYSSCQTAL